MSGPARIAHEIEKLERRPATLRIEELDELLPYVGDAELDRLVEVLHCEAPGWEAAVLKLLGPARAQQRRSSLVIFTAAARRELSSRHPAAPRLERVTGGWLVRSQSVEVTLAFDPMQEVAEETPPAVVEPATVPSAPAEAPSDSSAPTPTRTRRKKRSELTGREWHRSRARGTSTALVDREF
jgi:hypothetical protein